MFELIKKNKKEILQEIKKLFWILIVASIIGDLVEVAFIYFSDGRLMSRSSLLYGPFSLTWGGAAALLSLAYHKLKDKNILSVFGIGLIFGSLFEYLCSVASEINYGYVFWDYSHMPYNLNGRIYLPFCIFWGIATVLWIKFIYPKINKFIEKITNKIPYWLSIIILIIFIINIILSNLALYRYGQRLKSKQPVYQFEKWIDQNYPDDYVKNRYQNIHYK